MKKLLFCLMFSLMLGLSADQAFPLSYEIDVGQDGTFETGGSIDLQVESSITADIYVAGYDCTPDDKIFGLQVYIETDADAADVTNCTANVAGGCDGSLSGCTEPEDGVNLLVCSNFSFIDTVGGSLLVGTFDLTCKSQDDFTMTVANDLGPPYNDGFLADCNLDSIYPEDATTEIDQVLNNNITSTTSTGLPSSSTSSPSTTSTSDSSSTTTSNGPSSSTTTSSALTTTTSTSSWPCLFESLYGDNAEETVRARYFRDDVLRVSAEGREIIELYYLWSPVIVAAMERDPQLKREIRMMLDQFNSFFGEMP